METRNTTLTEAQHLIWLGQQLAAKMPLYNTVFTFRIHGHIDERRFVDAFRQLVESTDAMRLVVAESDGRPQARIVEGCSRPCELIDFSAAAKDAARDWLQQRMGNQLEADHCLYDSALLKVSEEEHIWFFNAHHLISDGWSTSVSVSPPTATVPESRYRRRGPSIPTASAVHRIRTTGSRFNNVCRAQRVVERTER